MRSPSIVPDFNHHTYLVLDDFGSLGRAWRETDEHQTGRRPWCAGSWNVQFENPVRVVAFNTSQGWARDATEDVAREVMALAQREDTKLTGSALRFVRATLRRRARATS